MNSEELEKIAETFDGVEFKQVVTQDNRGFLVFPIKDLRDYPQLGALKPFRHNNNFDVVKLTSGGRYPLHVHDDTDSEIHILRGQGRILIERCEVNYSPGAVCYIPRHQWHGFNANSDTMFFSALSSPIFNPETGKIDLRHN
ncbi:cupin domain-containing protein [Candidatus Pacearchaeota archaeon]|nr:cupin domain-containing protein [Candidatus Pacearchaeota archaeon]